MRVWRRPTVWVNAALIVLAVAGAGWAYLTVHGTSNPAAASTGAAQKAVVSTGNVTATVSASATVASASTAAANFVTSGTVTEVDVKVGDQVTKGQVLAKVDPTAAQETLNTAQANLQAAQDALTRAQSATTPDAATISAANAQVASAQATVDADQRAVAGCVLTAPQNGTVIAVNGSVGNSSGAGASGTGSTGSGGNSGGNGGGGGANNNSSSSSSSSSSGGFVQIADLTQLQVSGSFAESDATKLKVGQPANITWSALTGARATGKVATISPTATVSGGVNSYAVVVSLDSAPAGVRIGQTTTVAVTVAEADNVVRVPAAAVSSAGGRHTVTVLDNGVAKLTIIQVGVQGDNFDEVTSGLTDGQTVQLPLPSSAGTGNNNFRFPGGGGLGGGGGFVGGGGLGGAGGGGNRGGAGG